MLVFPYLYKSKPAAEADPFVGVDACSVNFAYFSLGAEFLETVVSVCSAPECSKQIFLGEETSITV